MFIDQEELIIRDKAVLFRNAEESDAQILLDYLEITCRETPFLVKEPEEITLTIEEEQAFIRSNNESENSLLLLGFIDGEHVGNCSLMGNEQSRYRHRVGMGIALYEKYTGMGIGRAMIEKLIQVATERGFEQMELEVSAENQRAISLYSSLGFETYGRLPDNMKYKDGSYTDILWMMKKL